MSEATGDTDHSPRSTMPSEAVEWQLVLTLFRQTATLVIGGTALAVAALVGWIVTREHWFLLWAIAIAVTLGSRLLLVDWAFRRRSERPQRVRFWRRRFLAGAWILGSLWGCSAFVIVNHVDPYIQMLVMSVQLVITMGGAARNAGYPLAAKGQVSISLVPVIVAFLLTHELKYVVLAIGTGLELFAALALIDYLHDKIVRLLCANEENLALVSAVQNANAELAALNNLLECAASTDGLTGIANRRRFDTILLENAERAWRERSPLALLLVDIDTFKGYNDLYGHLAGDDCLRRVAQAFAAVLRRPADLVARYGGEEFVAILPQTDASDAQALAERLRASIEALAIVNAAGVGGVVTVSIGVASFATDRHYEPQEYIRAADEALYAAKGAARNCVRVATPGPAAKRTGGGRRVFLTAEHVTSP